MATRSAIGIKNEKGEIKAVYCHWDGYPEHNGKLLVENYDTAEKIEELLALGDLSSLDVSIGTTKAYHRDRGEELNPAGTYSSIKEFFAEFENSWCEYFYVFEDGEWYVYETVDDRKLVKDVLKDLGV